MVGLALSSLFESIQRSLRDMLELFWSAENS